MKKILLIAIIVSLSFAAKSQVQEVWAVSHLGELQDQVVDASGNVYVTGRAYSAGLDLEGNLTIKHDRNGNEIWRHFSPLFVSATSMAVDASGNVYVAGATGYTYIDWPIEVDINVHFYLLKLNSNGGFEWSNTYLEDDYGVYGYPHELAIDHNGNPYATGINYLGFINMNDPRERYPDSSTAEYITIKYDAATGNRHWVKSYNGSAPGTGFDEARGLAIDPIGYIYVAGTSELNGEYDIATIKYDPNGNVVWVSRYSNPDPNYNNDFARGVKLDNSGNVIVGGFSHRISGISHKTLLIKYTFTGFELWVRQPLTEIFFSQFGPPLYYDVGFIVDNSNNIIDAAMVAGPNGTGFGMVKYNTNGDLLWEFPSPYDDLVVDNDNNIYIVWASNIEMNTIKISPAGSSIWTKKYTWPFGDESWIGIDADKNVYASDGVLGSLNSTYVTVRYSQCQITCPANITVNAPAGTCSTIVNYAAATTTGYCGSDITYSHASGSTFSVGTTTVTVTSTETGATCTFDITVVDNQNPVMTCPANISVNTDPGVCYASAGSVNATPPGASDNCNPVSVTGVRSDGASLNANYPAGITTITWTATDPSNNTATCSQMITVIDNVPPDITNTSVSQAVLSPPNHKMVDIYLGYTVTDNCGATTNVTVTSDEPETGLSNGDLGPDIIKINNNHWQLRAERDGKGDGRVYTLIITATDGSGNTSTATETVVVAHNIGSPHAGHTVRVGSTVNFSGTFWDVQGSRHSAKWVIDGNTTVKASVTEPAGMKNGKVTGSYRFNAPGVYKLRMDITDQNGITTSTSTSGDLEAIIVVYDPKGGYTYGGGYFVSPQGALRSDPLASGDAGYGYTINYYKNASMPKGETQFEFKVGEFEYNALNFEYLVISATKAQFRGTGKIIGGQSGISFIMTVIDGELDGTGVDKARMKIFNKNTGEIYYDNQPGDDDAADPVTPVGDNSIIVIMNNDAPVTGRQSDVTEEVRPFVENLSVAAYPNPFNRQFSLSITSPVSGMATIEFYTLSGARVYMDKKPVTAGAGNIFRYPGLHRYGNLLYRVTIGERKAAGILIKTD